MSCRLMPGGVPLHVLVPVECRPLLIAQSHTSFRTKIVRCLRSRKNVRPCEKSAARVYRGAMVFRCNSKMGAT
jgi:hypothetical protein